MLNVCCLVFNILLCYTPTKHDLSCSTGIVDAVRNGAIGSEFAFRATKDSSLKIRKLTNTGIPYDVYVINDFACEYSLLVEETELVLLCSGFGGGQAKNLKITSRGNVKVLAYSYETGSGVSITKNGSYQLGTKAGKLK